MEEALPAPPKISAIVLSFNTADSLRRCLAALDRSEARETLEIIVVDNGSQDESPTLDNEFPGATFLRMPRNFGTSKALNIAMRTAAGEYMFFVAPEIEVQPGTAATLAAILDSYSDTVAVCPWVEDAQGNWGGQLWKLPTPSDLSKAWRESDALMAVPPAQSTAPAAVEYAGLSALMARKFFIKGMNWFDERYGQFGPDLELAFQVRRANRKILLVPSARVIRRPPESLAWTSGQRAILSADRGLGAATFVSKHFGFFAGLRLRLAAVLYTLGQMLMFRDPGFQFSRLSALVSGQKVDGSQREL
jgi:GT2 family glycosyltransferase